MATPDDLELLSRALEIGSYRRHIFLCTHGDCAPREAANESWAFLKKRLRQLGLADAERGVYRAEAERLLESGVDLEIFDATHSELEDRFPAIGPIDRGIVVVLYMEPEEGRCRIIGARMASRRERDLYFSRRRRFE